ncbi:hypothetical protein A2U01_0084788, partial [Trifolium medium]|nr:hypothetical protein [Trifolium medium]
SIFVDLRGYRGDLWGWGQIFPYGDGDGGKNSPAGTSGRGTRKLTPHIPFPIDIPTNGNMSPTTMI